MRGLSNSDRALFKLILIGPIMTTSREQRNLADIVKPRLSVLLRNSGPWKHEASVSSVPGQNRAQYQLKIPAVVDF